jgi:uncharacterized membrane protein (UPF0127 family)
VRVALLATRRWALIAVLAATAACADDDVDDHRLRSDEPVGDQQAEPSAPPVEPVGFDLGAATIETAAGDVLELTLWVADTADERHRGLTGVTNLGAAAGMLFLFDVEGTPRFHMSQTPMPLDIAFFNANGDFVSGAAMDPCLDQASSRCERYSPDAPVQAAIELPRGSLNVLGIDEGSSLTLP